MLAAGGGLNSTLCLSPKAGKLAVERGWAINVGECWGFRMAGLAWWSWKGGGQRGTGKPSEPVQEPGGEYSAFFFLFL